MPGGRYSPADDLVQECPYGHHESMRGSGSPYRIMARHEDVVFAARHPEMFSPGAQQRRIDGLSLKVNESLDHPRFPTLSR